MNVFKAYFFLMAFFISIDSNAQIGIRISYEQSNYDDFAAVADKADLLSTQYSAGIEYWFRMKNVRVEFFPEIYFLRADDTNLLGTSTIDYSVNALGLLGKTHFYFMDFFGDCDCPTFSKQGNLLTKGFYLALAPGVQMDMQNLTVVDENLDNKSNNLHFKLNLGAGLDLGIMDKWTVSPFIFYNITPKLSWNDFGILHDPLNGNDAQDKSIQRSVQTGIRLHYRWDY